MILSAIQTEQGALLRKAENGQLTISEYPTIAEARKALIDAEMAATDVYPSVRAMTQWSGEDMTVVISGLPQTQSDAMPKRHPWRRIPSAANEPEKFSAWRYGVIRRIAESVREELMEPGEPAELEIG